MSKASGACSIPRDSLRTELMTLDTLSKKITTRKLPKDLSDDERYEQASERADEEINKATCMYCGKFNNHLRCFHCASTRTYLINIQLHDPTCDVCGEIDNREHCRKCYDTHRGQVLKQVDIEQFMKPLSVEEPNKQLKDFK